MGGEKESERMKSPWMEGSPPHGRGKELPFVGLEPHTGITPAWAGKSRHGEWLQCKAGDHPRMGGEKLEVVNEPACFVGSPPHGRGKGSRYVPIFADPRITPAWAGKRKRYAFGKKYV